MATNPAFRDALYRLAQVGERLGVQLVRITAQKSDNRYTARPLEFDEDGEAVFAEETTLTVTNLGEPADQAGQVPVGTDAVALDVEGRWVIFLRQSETGTFPAKITDSQGSAAYTLREQVATGPGQFANKTGTSDITAYNLAELSLGPGAAVDNDTIVMVSLLLDTGDPPTVRYVFDHPVYAKYLD